VNVPYPAVLHVLRGDNGGVAPGGWVWWRARGGGGQCQLQGSRRGLNL
jgi:hypothetical protein